MTLWRWAGIAGALVLVYVFASFFDQELGRSRPVLPAGVQFAAPPGYLVEQAGALERAAAARRLGEALTRRPEAGRLALHFTVGGDELYWLVDRSAGSAPRLTELLAGASGTRVETVYTGELGPRLAWAAAHGSFDAPGTAAGVQRNLYH
jgi:hypothetical protein